ncbi:MAG: sugar ABC transporter ATP-binding protein [Bacteroidales bacterium]|nr:sugar ABC transporter ATP-binding protein [Bacteroidales bacterium]
MDKRESILQIEHLSKSFPGVKALDDVNLEVSEGEVHVVMGENGAGKSTLMKILAGVYHADEGRIVLDGKEVFIASPQDAINQGINLIYQELSVAPNISVSENIFLGSEKSRFGIVDRSEMNRISRGILRTLGAAFPPETRAGTLSIAEQQQIEIARALNHQSRILIMDEPTAALSDRETDKLFEVVFSLRDQGIAVLYISHRMNEVIRIADRVSILRDGQYVGTLDKEDINPDTIVTMMVGRSLEDFYEHKISTNIRPGTFIVENISDGKTVNETSFSVGAGEILGLAGLVGAGRAEMSRLIFGIDKKTSGQIYLDGEKLSIQSPGDAIKYGLGFVPEDRKLQGLFLQMSVGDNISMNVLGNLSKAGILKHSTSNNYARGPMSDLNVRAASTSVSVESLSGGNQQKVLLARWLAIKPKVLILDEPTRGVDVGAKSEIYKIMGELASQGVAIIFISSELPEIVGIAQRVLIMREGSIVSEISNKDEISQENIMYYATGAKTPNYTYKKTAGKI